MKAKLEDLEARSKRQNIRIIGIPECAERRRPTELITELITTVLGKEHFGLDFKVDRAHRSLVARPGESAPTPPPDHSSGRSARRLKSATDFFIQLASR